jgi:putative ABC transport system permease protein
LEQIRGLSGVAQAVPQRILDQEARRERQRYPARLVATTADLVDMMPMPLAAGRFLTLEDESDLKNVVVLGSAVARTLFGSDDPLGHTVQIGSHTWFVVGVLQARGEGEGNSEMYLPLRTFQARFGEKVLVRQAGVTRVEAVALSRILVSVSQPEQVQATVTALADLLQLHHLHKDWDVKPAAGVSR